jgi:hypothetical protein
MPKALVILFNPEFIREKLDKANQKNEKDLKDQVDYLIMKTYFTVPYFPVFKPSTLRKDFNMAVYLRYCLLDKLRLFFKISWTSWFVAIISVFLWSVLIVPSSIEFSVRLNNIDLLYDINTATWFNY